MTLHPLIPRPVNLRHNQLYEMRLTEIKARRGIGEKEDCLDRQGVEELAANEFRITQTAVKIRRENI